MTETPRSERYNTRFSTPVEGLDDHRHQPEHLPRADTSGTTQHPWIRRGTAASSQTVDRPNLVHVNEALRNGYTARDFEQAIIDDDRSERGSIFGNDATNDRYGSLSPQVARRATYRRPQHLEVNVNRSRTSTIASREESPPNSVDAFAEPRSAARGRAGTANSLSPAFLEHTRSRTGSNAGRTRRYTFDEPKPADRKDDDTSSQGSVEDDVCFPEPEETKRLYTIDFDELHDFVESERENSAIPKGLRRRCSFSCQSRKPPLSRDPMETKSKQNIPTIVTDLPVMSNGQDAVPNSSDTTIGGPCSDSEKENEKLDESGDFAPKAFEKELVHRWSFFSSEQEQSIHATDLGDLLLPGQTFFDLFALGPEDGVWWLDMLYPTEEEVEVICKAFGVHRLTREDILEQEMREKVELFKSYYFVCFRSFISDAESEDYLEEVNVYAVVFQEGILTFSFKASPHAANVRKRMGKLRDYASLGSNWICYALVDDIVDMFAPAIREIEHTSDAIEDSVFTIRPEDSRDLLRQIGQTRKKVMSLIRLLGGKADVIKGFAKRCNENYAIAPRQDIGMYLSDVQDHVVTMMGSLAHFEKMLSRSHSNYLAQISVDNIVQGNKANKILAKVTLIATLLVPMNLVTGLFGMNVPVPGKNNVGLGWFFGIIGFLILFVVVSMLIAKRQRWV